MKALISRTYSPDSTRGAFLVMEGHRKLLELVCIELPDEGNKKGISCILEGIYDVIKAKSPLKGDIFLLLDVQGRTAVEIHIGNFAAGLKKDTEGCILPGMYFADINKDGHIDVAESTNAMKLLLSTLPNKFKLHIL